MNKWILLAATTLFSSHLYALPYSDLKEYAVYIARSVDSSVQLRLTSVEPTMKRPFYTYIVVYETGSKELMSIPGAGQDKELYMKNRIKTEAWQRKFCTNSLSAIMRKHDLDMVSGQIKNLAGEFQRIAVCNK